MNSRPDPNTCIGLMFEAAEDAKRDVGIHTPDGMWACVVFLVLLLTLTFPAAAGDALGVTTIGPARSGGKLNVAVSWTGDTPQVVRGWMDLDRSGDFTDDELVLPATLIERPMQVMEVSIPGRAAALDDWELVVIAEEGGLEARTKAVKAVGTCSWEGGFEINGTDLAIYDIQTHNGNLFVGGAFERIAGKICNNIAKWDGSEWSCLGSGLPATVRALEEFGGALYIGGDFMVLSPPYPNRIVRWDDSTATWSNLGLGTNNTVRDLVVHNGALYAGGDFTTAGGIPANRVARWDGSSWSALTEGTENGVSGRVRSLAVFNGNLVVAGDFIYAGGSPVWRIARWDETSSDWSALGSGFNASVYALGVFPVAGSDRLFAGGSFSTAGGYAASRIASWDGSAWSALGSGADGLVRSFDVYDGLLVVGGDFTDAGGVAAEHIASWDGAVWSTIGIGVNDSVHTMGAFDGDLFVAGAFSYATNPPSIDVVAAGVARWNGTSWSALQPPGNGMTGDVLALAVFDDGGGPDLYAGGQFTTAGGTVANRVARWDGSDWSVLGPGMDHWVNCLATYDENPSPAVDETALYAGGRFLTAGGSAIDGIAKWDGSAWSALGSGLQGFGSEAADVKALAVFNGELYVGGDFSSAGIVSTRNIARWNGSAWSGVGGGCSGTVNAWAVFGGELYAGGYFTEIGGATIDHIAKWNGSSWSPVESGDPPASVDSAVYALAAFDGALFAAGSFTTAGTQTVNNIAKWDGTSWSALGSGLNSYATALAVYDNGSGPALYVGGNFTASGTYPNSVYLQRIGKWDGVGWSNPVGSGVWSLPYALAGFDDGSGPALYAGGSFGYAGGVPSERIAKWSCTCECEQAIPLGEWALISLGCAAPTPTVANLFGDELPLAAYGSTWTVIERDEDSDVYRTLELTDTVSQGDGYWFKSIDTVPNLNVTGGRASTICPTSSAYDECFDVELVGESGGRFNLKGFPFASAVPWADVRFVDASGTEYSPTEAEAAGIASKNMYLWNGNDYDSYDPTTPAMAGWLEESSGFWVEAYQNLTLRMPTAAALAEQPGDSTESDGRVSLSPGDWFVRLLVTGDGMLSQGTLFGRLSDSIDGLDQHDLDEMAPFGDRFLTTVFPHQEWGTNAWSYASDYRQERPGAGGKWDFEIRSDSPRQVTLSWHAEGTTVGEILASSRLVDGETGAVINPGIQSSVTVTMTAASHPMSWRVNAIPAVVLPDLDDVLVGEQLSVSAPFFDEDPDNTHVATIDWGDGSSGPGDVDGSDRIVRAVHAYDEAGQKTVSVCVEDDWGGRGCDASAVIVQGNPLWIFGDGFEFGGVERWSGGS